MIDKSQIISAIETELLGAENAKSEEQYKTHMHTIHVLSGLTTNQSDYTTKPKEVRLPAQAYTSSSKAEITNEEIKKMGGKVTTSKNNTHIQNDNLLSTDDGLGNGDSIFDF